MLVRKISKNQIFCTSAADELYVKSIKKQSNSDKIFPGKNYKENKKSA